MSSLERKRDLEFENLWPRILAAKQHESDIIHRGLENQAKISGFRDMTSSLARPPSLFCQETSTDVFVVRAFRNDSALRLLDNHFKK